MWKEFGGERGYVKAGGEMGVNVEGDWLVKWG
jgi:hypothetical protein